MELIRLIFYKLSALDVYQRYIGIRVKGTGQRTTPHDIINEWCFMNILKKILFTGMLSTVAFAAPVFAQAGGWQQTVGKMIAAKQTYPRAAQMRGDSGTAKVKVSFASSGAVTSVELVSPSGSAVLDREAVQLPQKVGTFPAPPGGATSVVIPITWKLI